jgi:serine/threonine protein kinase
MPNKSEQAALWARARGRFLELAELEGEAQRSGLARLQQVDPELAVFVERLLAQDASAEERTTRPNVRERIGPYTVLEKLGEGGFGAVYRARQEHPIVREVALKVQKAGLDSPELVARFADERRYLARIDHPDVVKVLDAGVTDDGRLYVAMELVRGEPITEYVARERPPLAERIALLARVARAVHHVHQRAILHRDLKPTNILVTRVDGVPRPRLIDFGIATALSNADRVGWTRLVGPICTPGYAAPEQLAGSENIDVRTDVYALGCVLCECLTGERPRESSTAASTPPRRPSELSAAVSPAARSSPIPPAALRGELDLVVLKCVATDPDERYESAAELAADLERFLRFEPVHATPPTAWTIARKFARRNRVAVTIAGAAVCFVAVAAGVAVDGRRRALNERAAALEARDAERLAAERAQQVTKYFLEDMVQQLDFDARPTRPMTLTELLAAAEEDASERYADDPAIRALVLEVVARSHFKATRYAAAERTLLAALAAADAAHGVPNRKSFELLLLLCDARLHQDGGLNGPDYRERAAADASVLFREGDLELLQLRQRGMGNAERLAAVLTEIIAAYEASGASGTDDYFQALQLLAEAQRMSQGLEAQLVTLRKLRSEALQRLHVDHSVSIAVTSQLGRTLCRLEQWPEGLGLLTDAYERSRRVLGPDHETALLSAREYAIQLGAMGRAAEGLPIIREVCERTASTSGEGSLKHTTALGYLGRLLAQSGAVEEAEALQRQVLTARETQWSEKATMRIVAMQELAETCVLRGAYEEALTLANDAQKRTEPGTWRALQVTCVRAEALAGMQHFGKARALLDEALAQGVEAGLDARDLARARGLRASLGP